MTKNWWFKFEFNKWRNDSLLRQCSLETKGFWVECICVMREMGTDRLKGSYAEIARMVGCFPDEVERCIAELKRTKTADVTLGNADVTPHVTLVSRYIKKEAKARELTRLRVQKLRCNAHVTHNVTPTVTDRVISKSKELEKEKKEEGKKPPDDLGKDLVIIQTETALSTKLDLDEKRAVSAAIPGEFAMDWGVFLRARILKVKGKPREVLIAHMGYALTDFRRDHKREYEQLKKPEQKLPSTAEVERQREEWRNQPRELPDGTVVQGLPS